MDLMRIYDAAPVFIQNIMCSVEGYRVRKKKYGSRQKKFFTEYMSRKDWTYEKVVQYRDERLRAMVEHCYNHVPYYHELFNNEGIDYRSIRSLQDLAILPILTKQTVTQNFNSFIADNVDKEQLLPMHTSGTTGSAFHFYYTKDAYAQQWAEDERYTESVGINLNDWKAYFGGRSIVPKESNSAPFYRVNRPMKEVLFSAWHMSPRNFPSYIEGMERYKPVMWHGYPSSIGTIAQYMLDEDKRLSFTPKIIYLSSENVSKNTEEKIQKAFGVKPIQGYAQTEGVATFREFPDKGIYVIEDFSAVELCPEDGLFRVVGSTLTNYAMPLLRYDTKDLVTYEETEYGRRILSIEGRIEDNIKLHDGGVIRRLSRLFQDQLNIIEAQIVQKDLDSIEFRVVKGAHFTLGDEEKLKKDAHDYLAGRISFSIKYVDSIPKSANGKRKFIVSEV